MSVLKFSQKRCDPLTPTVPALVGFDYPIAIGSRSRRPTAVLRKSGREESRRETVVKVSSFDGDASYNRHAQVIQA